MEYIDKLKELYKNQNDNTLEKYVKIFNENYKNIFLEFKKEYDSYEEKQVSKYISKYNARYHNTSKIDIKIIEIISFLHNSFNDLLINSNLYVEKLLGSKEMRMDIERENEFYVFFGKDDFIIEIFKTYTLIFYLESFFNSHLILGMDFEFMNKNGEKIFALMQFCFENHKLNYKVNESRISIIFLIDPNKMDKELTDIYLNFILLNSKLPIILQGSDSLDLPRIYKFLDYDADKIIKFTKKLIDLRFSCEYYKLNKNLNADKTCGLYDVLVDFDTITKEKLDELYIIEADMGPKQDIVWIIDKMGKNQIKYAYYDVLFLRQYYNDITNKAIKDEPKNKYLKIIYEKVIIEITRFLYLERETKDGGGPYTNLITKCKDEVDPLNMFMVRYTKQKKPINLILNNIFKESFKDIYVSQLNLYLEKLFKINFFASKLKIIFKKMMYTIINENYQIFEKKNVEFNGKLSNRYVHEFMMDMKFDMLAIIMHDVESMMKDIITKYIENK